MKNNKSKVPDYVIQFSKGGMKQVSKTEASKLIKQKGLPILLERIAR